MSRIRLALIIAVIGVALTAACGGNKPPVAQPTPPPQPFPGAGGPPTTQPNQPPVTTPPPTMPSEPSPTSDPLATMTPDEINQQSPLKPVFFAYDSDEIDDTGRKTLTDDAQILKKYGTWVITVEGHCDERGTAEYNLALGERRALAAKNYLLTLGITADRIRTVSYGKEFPFDPGHEEAAWSKNRRAHLMVTSK